MTKKDPTLEELLEAVQKEEASRDDYKVNDDVTNWILFTKILSGKDKFTAHFLFELYKLWSVSPSSFDKFIEVLKKNFTFSKTTFLIDGASIDDQRKQLLKQIGTKRRDKSQAKRRIEKKSQISRS